MAVSEAQPHEVTSRRQAQLARLVQVYTALCCGAALLGCGLVALFGQIVMAMVFAAMVPAWVGLHLAARRYGARDVVVLLVAVLTIVGVLVADLTEPGPQPSVAVVLAAMPIIVTLVLGPRYTWRCFGVSVGVAELPLLLELPDPSVIPDLVMLPIGSGLLTLVAYTVAHVWKREQGELEQALQAAQAGEQAKQTLLRIVSHELRTPLNAVLGVQSLLLEASSDPDEADLLRIAQADALKLERLVEGLLEVADGRTSMRPTWSELDVGDLLDEVQADFRKEAAALGVTVERVVEPGLPPAIHTDGERVHRILYHLVDNAVRFSQQGTVTLVACGLERGLCLEVHDQGPGIPPERLQHLFEPFEQGDGGMTREVGGVGLGLTHSRLLAEEIDASLSARPGEQGGMVFRLEVPCRGARGRLAA